MNATTISILIPVYNEVRFIREVLDRILIVDFCGLEKDIIIVDDGSTDGTREILKDYENRPPFRVVYHDRNRGKGAALRTAIQHASGQVIAIQDADLEYDPKDYPELIRLILDGKADVVYGSRLSAGKPVRAFNVLHYFGNKFLTLLTNILYNTTLTDMETCYKAFRADLLQSITIRSDRFEFEPEITAKVLKRKARLYEAPISYYGRNFEEGKKITWRDGLGAMWALLKYRLVD
jgi:glycosyltransferase involved in cell wall biosynthesis